MLMQSSKCRSSARPHDGQPQRARAAAADVHAQCHVAVCGGAGRVVQGEAEGDGVAGGHLQECSRKCLREVLHGGRLVRSAGTSVQRAAIRTTTSPAPPAGTSQLSLTSSGRRYLREGPTSSRGVPLSSVTPSGRKHGGSGPRCHTSRAPKERSSSSPVDESFFITHDPLAG